MATKTVTGKKKKTTATKASTSQKTKQKTVKKAPAKKPAAKKAPAKKTTVKKTTVKPKAKVAATPKGYNTVTPYLIIDNAAKAIEFYKQVFGAKEVMRMQKPDGKIGHAELKIGDAKIMLADEYLECDARAPKAFGGSPVSIHLYMKSVDSVVDRAVSAGAKLTRPVENMFYGDRSGMLEDPYGHKWCVSTHIENVSPAQMKKRAAELFGN